MLPAQRDRINTDLNRYYEIVCVSKESHESILNSSSSLRRQNSKINDRISSLLIETKKRDFAFVSKSYINNLAQCPNIFARRIFYSSLTRFALRANSESLVTNDFRETASSLGWSIKLGSHSTKTHDWIGCWLLHWIHSVLFYYLLVWKMWYMYLSIEDWLACTLR